ncbi:MAG TPA: DUF2993 domain-containing protein [Nostocaceae cyanobacterium]|nr:DUF2993 domain-containing protein [Nostocaceae cyanobacterium]
MYNNQKLAEKLLSQEATRRVSNQLDQVEEINIEVQTDLLKICQGQIDAVSLAGQGIVVQKQIRLQEINLQTDSIAINLLSMIFGKITLAEPVNALARIVLTESDINRAISSKLIRNLVKTWQLNVAEEIIGLELQQMQISLQNDSQIECQGKVLIKEKGKNQTLGYTATIYTPFNSQSTVIRKFYCTEEEGISVEFVLAFMQSVKSILNLSHFQGENMAFTIKDITVENRKLILMIEAQIKQIPSLDTDFLVDTEKL